MIILAVKFRSRLSEAEGRRVIAARAGEFRSLPGLLQKFYVHEPATGEYGGIYFWDSPASLQAFRESELSRTIAASYQVAAPPRIEVFQTMAALRAEPLAPLAAAMA